MTTIRLLVQTQAEWGSNVSVDVQGDHAERDLGAAEIGCGLDWCGVMV